MNRYKYTWLFVLLLSAVTAGSCKKYLGIEPKGVQLLKTVDDFDLWLNADLLSSGLPNEINLLADNFDMPSVELPLETVSDRAYTWQPQFSEDPFVGQAVIWKEMYVQIYYYNTLLESIDAATGGTEEKKKSLKAEALLGRAFSYLYLVNLYGNVYNAATAGQDLSVPFVTSHDLNDPTPNRSSVQEIYDHIIGDLQTAIPDLPASNGQNRFRGSKAAGYSVLARAYLFMGNHPKAAENAQLALNNQPGTIGNYAAMSSVSDIPVLNKRPDVLYGRVSSVVNNAKDPTLDFLRKFDVTDLRLKFFYANTGDYSFTVRNQVRYRPAGVSATRSVATPNWGTTLAEMQLILAEAAAEADDLPLALDLLDELRKKRFPVASYTKYQSTDQDEVIDKIFGERNFEFAFEGMRWIDMRRQNAKGKMPDVQRFLANGSVLATLPKSSPRYILQVPVQIMLFNPGWKQNP